LIENQERYQEASEALEEMLSWQDMHKSPPTTLLVYSKREKLRCQMLFDTSRPLFKSACTTQGATTDTCTKLWRNANDLVEEAGVQPMQSIDETTSSSTRMVEVEDHKKSIQMNIQNLCQFEEKSIEEHLLKPARLTHKIQSFVKNTTEQLYQEVSTKVCNGELVLERLQSSKLESILRDHSILERIPRSTTGTWQFMITNSTILSRCYLLQLL
jgi:hypothetical protein